MVVSADVKDGIFSNESSSNAQSKDIHRADVSPAQFSQARSPRYDGLKLRPNWIAHCYLKRYIQRRAVM
jgi:hypothetical protein